MSDKTTDFRLIKVNVYAIADYLADALEKNDHDEVLKAICRVMRAQNFQALARDAGLRRDRLYKSFGGEVDPLLSRVMALFNALGVALTAKALPPREIPSRPKLGRPKKSNPQRPTD